MKEPELIAPLRALLRVGLGSLVLATGVGKALDVGGFAGVLETYRLGLDGAALHGTATGIAALEIVLGLWILTGKQLRRAMWTSVAVDAAYFVLLTSALARGLDLRNCGCFGVFFARPLRWYSPLEDLALIALSLLLLALATDALRARTSLTIRAPRSRVMAIYRDVAGWSRLFPTIRAARLLRDQHGAQVIEVDHRRAGKVVNLLRTSAADEIELEEFKPRYDGRFRNRFESVPEGTRYTISAEIRPNGLWKLVAGPWLNGYIRRQMAELVLEPVRRVAEERSA